MTEKNSIKEFFIFNRDGVCLFHLDLQDYYSSNDDSYVPSNKALNITDKKLENKYKLIYGFLFSMKSFVKNLSPNGATDFFKSYTTSTYKLHYIEFINGLRFILFTSTMKVDLGKQIKDVYSSIYVNYISKNLFIEKDSVIKNDIFAELVMSYFLSLNKSLAK